jgi:hypothetical protein
MFGIINLLARVSNNSRDDEEGRMSTEKRENWSRAIRVFAFAAETLLFTVSGGCETPLPMEGKVIRLYGRLPRDCTLSIVQRGQAIKGQNKYCYSWLGPLASSGASRRRNASVYSFTRPDPASDDYVFEFPTGVAPEFCLAEMTEAEISSHCMGFSSQFLHLIHFTHDSDRRHGIRPSYVGLRQPMGCYFGWSQEDPTKRVTSCGSIDEHGRIGTPIVDIDVAREESPVKLDFETVDPPEHLRGNSKKSSGE